MLDLFLAPDDRLLLAKWDYLSSVFRLAARDYRRVLDGSVPADRHRTILMQTVSDMLELEADLNRLGKPTPAAEFGGWTAAAWGSAAAWVRELRAWRVPPDHLAVPDIEAALVRRQALEVAFNAVVADLDPDATAADDPPAVVVSRAG